VQPLLAPLGITRVANVTGLDAIGIPVVMVVRPNARSVSVAQGKGLSLAAAKASGIMEAIEGYHSEHILLPLKQASYEELRYTHRVLDPALLPRLSDGAFHPHRPITWIEGFDLIQREPVWLPFDLAHTNFTVAACRSMAGFVASSNGLASGNHLLEAISHAICEVVERDAVQLWRLQPAAARSAARVDLSSIDDPDCQSVLERYARAGVIVGVWDITSDVGVPAFVCRIVDAEHLAARPTSYSESYGCHPLRSIALLRALTEAAQERLTIIAGARDDARREQYKLLMHADTTERARQELAQPGPQRPFGGAEWRSDTFDADIGWMLERLRAVGVQQVVAIDLTRPEFRVPVVKIVIPGLETISKIGACVPGPRARRVMGLQP
jgi:ribosomal protein S12 methylthiotransferase accessory factor